MPVLIRETPHLCPKCRARNLRLVQGENKSKWLECPGCGHTERPPDQEMAASNAARLPGMENDEQTS